MCWREDGDFRFRYMLGNDRYGLEHKGKAWARDTDSAATSALTIVMGVGETIQVCCLGSEKGRILRTAAS